MNRITKLYLEVIDKLGCDSQINKAIEECGELIVALEHYKFGHPGMTPLSSVITEIADVSIMCEQLALIFGKELVDKEIDAKRERLAERLLNSELAKTDRKRRLELENTEYDFGHNVR